jgi:myosin heavy subunit
MTTIEATTASASDSGSVEGASEVVAEEVDRRCRLLVASLLEEVLTVSPHLFAANEETQRLYEVGKTKIYFVAGVLEKMETLRNSVVLDTAKYLQVIMRSHILKWRCQRMFQRCKRSAVRIQANFRMRKVRRQYLKLLLALRKIQRWCHTRLVRKHFLLKRRSSIAIQKTVRGLLPFRRYHKVRRGMIRLQAVARSVEARVYLARCVRSACRIQTRGRILLAKRQLLRRRKERAAGTILWALRLVRDKRRFKKALASVVTVQRAVRRKFRRQFRRARGRRQLQQAIRGWVSRRRFLRFRRALVVLQAYIRVWRRKRFMKRQHQAANTLQVLVRRYVAKKRMLRFQRAIVLLQSVVRMRREKNRLKQAMPKRGSLKRMNFSKNIWKDVNSDAEN